VGEGLTLQFDHGILASEPPIDHPDYVISEETIGGFTAVMVRPRFAGDRTTGVFFVDDLAYGGRQTRFNLAGHGPTEAQNELAFAIFRTLRFKPGN
jgi:hypothetical protein